MAQVPASAYTSLLTRLGAPATPQTLRFFNAWQRSEGGNAAYNPFNTTQPYQGASTYNGVGVRNYPTLQAGVDATAQTITNGHYQSLVRDLRRGADPLTLAHDVASSPWGTNGSLLERVLGSTPATASQPQGSWVDALSGAAPSPAAAPQASGGSWVDSLAGGTGVRPVRAPDTVARAPMRAPNPSARAPKPSGSWVDALAAPPGATSNPLAQQMPIPATTLSGYPLATRGKVIGVPYKGTHTLYGNWESDNAVDIATPAGTPVVALADGTIGPQFGPLQTGGDPRLEGLRLHLVTPGDEFYYAHLSRFAPGVKPGVRVKAGQVIGYSGAANGVQHLHLGERSGNPLKLVG
jgi:murein DD-endopeptidase MepM/ murein hydrolase activator NlpD